MQLSDTETAIWVAGLACAAAYALFRWMQSAMEKLRKKQMIADVAEMIATIRDHQKRWARFDASESDKMAAKQVLNSLEVHFNSILEALKTDQRRDIRMMQVGTEDRCCGLCGLQRRDDLSNGIRCLYSHITVHPKAVCQHFTKRLDK